MSSGGPLAAAQAAFDQAQIDFISRHWIEAASGFEKAYATKAFPQFLYNIGASYYQLGKQSGSFESYQKSVAAFARYLGESRAADGKDPSDLEQVNRRIAVMQKEIDRLKAGGAAAVSAPPPPEVAEDMKIRGLFVIESNVMGATIYLDDKKNGPFAYTPWSGTLEGTHTLIIEKRGYKPKEKAGISADPSKLFFMSFDLAEENSLGWLVLKSNVPGADIYLDDKSVGAISKTPFAGSITPGKHTLWVSADGYTEEQREIEIPKGEVQELRIDLRGSPVGKLNVVGVGLEEATIYLDGRVLCERGPCRRSATQGHHRLTVKRQGYKSYTTSIDIQARVLTDVKVGLARQPGRGDAVAMYVLAAAFTGGGVFAGLQSKNIKVALQDDLKSTTPPANDDPRFFRGKLWAWGADGAFALGGIFAVTAIYYTFRDKGPSSTGLKEDSAMALVPQVGPTFAGLGLEGSF